MDYKLRQQRIILFIGLVIFITASCNVFNEVLVPTAVATTTNTPIPFKLGDPTATPLGNDITDPNYIKGVEAVYADNYEEALALLSAAIIENPNLAPPYQYRGLVYWSLGDCNSGLADEQKALSINPNYAAAWARRGLNYWCLGDEEQALKDYQKALSIDPSLAFVHHNLGYYYFLQGDFERSLDEYGLAVLIDPNRSGTWSSMADLQSRLGLYDECILNATKALEVNMEEWVAYSVRAVCKQFRGDPQAAIQDNKIYLEHNPSDAPIWSNLGLAQQDAKLFEDALASHNTALELDPSYYQANINRGLVYIDMGEYDKALDDFNHALEFGDIPAAYSGRGKTYYFLGQYDEAIADLELARDMMPNRPTSYCFLAFTYYEVGRYQDALDSAAGFDQLERECGAPLLQIQARSYYALGDYEQAIFYMNQALDLQPSAMGFYYRGTIYQAAGRNEEATRDFEVFLDLANLLHMEDFQVEITDAEIRLEQMKK